ncbi:MAG: proton-conducting transporter membrane subunit [Candidatus Dormibacteria bacterium]
MLAVPILGVVVTAASKSPRRLFQTLIGSQVLILTLALVLISRILRTNSMSAFSDWLYLDSLGAIVLLIVALVGLAAAVYSAGYLGHELESGVVGVVELRKYLFLYHLFVLTMLLASVSGNLTLLWTAVSATTLASAPLVDFYGSHRPLEAAWKFIVLTVAGSLIALFGFLLLYASATGVLGGSYNFSVPVLSAVAPHLRAVPAATGFLLVLVGFGTKAGLAPMHSWLPDAHSQAPSPVCAMLSGAELNCGLLGIFRVYALARPAAGPGTVHGALLAFGVLSVAVGVVFLISQRDFKRLLAYSSVEQMGVITLGVGLGGSLAVLGAFLQMFNHALAKSLMFFATGNLLLRFRSTAIHDVTGAVRQMPATAIVLLAGGLAIAGAPPFGLFISEFAIIRGAFRVNQWAFGAVLAALLLIGFLALFAPFNRMAFGRPGRLEAVGHAELNWLTLLPAYLLLGAVLTLGVWVPGPLHQLLQGAARVVSQ